MDLFEANSNRKKIYSVSQLNRATKGLLSQHFSIVQVEGEISNLSRPSSGHIYFSLKDKKAQIRCAMFKSQQQRLGFTPENGKQVTLSAQVSLYEARGDYQLIVNTMQEAGTGDLQLAFDQLKTKLLNEGLFESSRKKPIPEMPAQIGVITSPTGAAIHDILSVLKRRFPIIPIILYPVSVQGESAKFEICSALETANVKAEVDVIILARGGGSIEDLWAFNEECVARAIVKSDIPVISAVGHETDFSIADFIADLRAPTPSAAAENSVPDQYSWLATFKSLENQLHQSIHRRLAYFKQSNAWLSKRLHQQHPGQQLQRHAQALDNLELRLTNAMQSKIRDSKNQIKNQQSQLLRHNPADKIIGYKQQQQYLSTRLESAIKNKCEKLQRQYLALVQTLNAVSPLATLERGYAIVTEPNTSSVISSTQHLSINDKIQTRLAQGQVISQITEINHD